MTYAAAGRILLLSPLVGLLGFVVSVDPVPRAGRDLRLARSQVESLNTALRAFHDDVGRVPSAQEGLRALTARPPGVPLWQGPYLPKDLPNDPWGRPFVYRNPGTQSASADVVSWEKEK